MRVRFAGLLILLVAAGGTWCGAEPEPLYRDRPPRRPEQRVLGNRDRSPRGPQSDQAASGPTDALGYYTESRRYASIAGRGIAVVNLPQNESFFVYWVPPDGSIDHVLVLLHGTGGTAYDELADELDLAQQRGYALVSLQWLNKRTEQYADGSTVNRWLDLAVRYLEERFGRKVGRVGLSGFSRGGAMSYEVAYRDRMGAQHVSFVIAHSGGIHPDGVIAPRESNSPGGLLVPAPERPAGTGPRRSALLPLRRDEG